MARISKDDQTSVQALVPTPAKEALEAHLKNKGNSTSNLIRDLLQTYCLQHGIQADFKNNIQDWRPKPTA